MRALYGERQVPAEVIGRALMVLLTLFPVAARSQDGKTLAEVFTQLDHALAQGDPCEATAALAGLPPLCRKADEKQQVAVVALIGGAPRARDLRIRHGAFGALGAATIEVLQGVTGQTLTTPEGWRRGKEQAKKQSDPFR